MPVEVRIPTMLRASVGGAATVSSEGETVGEIVESLVTRFPALGGQVITADGALHKFVNVYVNDDDIRYLSKLDTKVAEGDTVSIIPAVAGGA
ncbi:MAG: ubiquitin-like small modifier protein 1 [Acidimicrobiales bacterium]